MCYVYPYLGKMNPFLLVFFSNGLVQPPTRRDLNKGKDVFFCFFFWGGRRLIDVMHIIHTSTLHSKCGDTMAGLEQQKQAFTSMLNWQKVNVLLSLTCILSSFCIPCFSVHAEIQ